MACFSGGKYVAFNAENQDMLYLHVLVTSSSIYKAKTRYMMKPIILMHLPLAHALTY